MLHESLGLVIFILFGHIFLLNLVVCSGLATAEDNAPQEDSKVTNDHSDETGCDTHTSTNQDWDEDVENDAPKEATKPTVSVVVTVRSVWMCMVRGDGLGCNLGFGLCLWSLAHLSHASSLKLGQFLGDDGSPLAENSGAFLFAIGNV